MLASTREAPEVAPAPQGATKRSYGVIAPRPGGGSSSASVGRSAAADDVAGVLLPIVLLGLVADAVRGSWGRVVVEALLAVGAVVAIVTLARLPGGPRA